MAIEIKSGDLLSSVQLEHHMKIYAGPGAGKTHFLVENIKNIVKNDDKIKGSVNRKILCITYTNAAVGEIKSRLENYTRNVDVFTIHGFIIQYIIKPYQTELRKLILKDFGINLGGSSKISSQIEGLGILHGHDKEEIFKFLNKESGTDDELAYSKKIMGDVQVDIETFCNDGTIIIKKADKINENHKIAIKKYIWTYAKKLTHDEILYFGYRIVTNNSTIAYALRVQFPFIFVDEFQDTNPLQAMLIKFIGAKSTLIGIIGDIAQSIYSFQGAKPSKFSEFSINDKGTFEYEILGNRRSTKNIVSLCNYIRQSDALLQESVKEYDNKDQKEFTEEIKVCFIIGDSRLANEKICGIIETGGVILTRAWAAAFNYMQGITDEQKKILKKVYNSYYISPIDIRSEIAEHNNVTWVRSFRFIFSLWDAFETKSIGDILNALAMYVNVNTLKESKTITANNIIQLNNLLTELFANHSETDFTVYVIDKFNELIKKTEYINLLNMFKKSSKKDIDVFSISCFTDADKEDLIKNITDLEWKTAYLLFRNVFSSNSRYMTVHQAKGLEWKKVVVSVEPTRNDKTKFTEMFNDPQIVRETLQDEFTRIFFVACSRAKEELYVHLKNNIEEVNTMKAHLEAYAKKNGLSVFFAFEYYH